MRRALASVHAELSIHMRNDRVETQVNSPGANDIVDLKPNFMGLGVNLNALIKRLWAKYRNERT